MQDLKSLQESIREDDPTCGYAAARIEALEAEVRSLRQRVETAERERDDWRRLWEPTLELSDYWDRRTEQLKGDLAATQTTIQNLQSALIAAGHDPDCPVVHGASAECVPGRCASYHGRVEADRHPDAVEHERDKYRAKYELAMVLIRDLAMHAGELEQAFE